MEGGRENSKCLMVKKNPWAMQLSKLKNLTELVEIC